jgi:hypothetical protein
MILLLLILPEKRYYFTSQWGRGASEVAEVYGAKHVIILVNYIQS